MAVAVAVTFSAPAFAGDPPKDTTKEEKKAPKHMVYGDEKDKKKPEGGKFTDTFGDEGKKPEEKKKDGK
jgi:hypothetical protein